MKIKKGDLVKSKMLKHKDLKGKTFEVVKVEGSKIGMKNIKNQWDEGWFDKDLHNLYVVTESNIN